MNKDIRDKTDIQAESIHINDNSHRCGYCHGKKVGGSKTWGLRSYKTRVDDYENMINKGWRRCGKYYYKTDLKGSCCQLYTIRLKVSEFKLSKKQRKTLNKFNRYLNGELDIKKEEEAKSKDIKIKTKSTTFEKYQIILENIVMKGLSETINSMKNIDFTEIKSKIQVVRPKDPHHGDLATNAVLILFNASKKTLEKPLSISDLQKLLITKIEAPCLEQKFKISSAPNGFINFMAEFDFKTVVDKEMEKIEHKEKKSHEPKDKSITNTENKTKAKAQYPKEEDKKPPQQYTNYLKEFVPNTNPNPVHKYTIEIVPAMATEETFELFKQYQEHIHNEPDKTMAGYKRFLCDSPLYDPNNMQDVVRSLPIDDSCRKFENHGVWPKYLGSYHMYHRIDGKLIAVGVLDYLPTMLSSVYFFYDTNYKFLNLGVVGALREIEYALKIQEIYYPALQYYNLGYCIMDCVKSVYKSEYCPSYLLCPETYTWVALEKVIDKIKEKGYTRLADKEVNIIDDMNFSKEEISNIMKSCMMIFSDNIEPFEDLTESFLSIAEVIIMKLGKSMMKNTVWIVDD